MSEGNVYLCTWAKRGRRLVLALERDPNVKVSAGELDEAEEKLCDLICEKYGDGEAVLEYETPPPVAATQFATRYGSPHLVIVTGNERLGQLVNLNEAYPGGICRDCRTPHDTETRAIPVYDHLPRADGAVVPEGHFFSHEFLSLLTDSELAGLRLSAIHAAKKSRRRFFRLDGIAHADFVGVPGFEGLILDRCPTCKRSLGIGYLRNNSLFCFLALCDLPKPLPQVFPIGRPGDVSLCMTRARFTQLLGKRGTRNITSSRVWVVPDDQFVRTPNAKNHPLHLRWEATSGFFSELA